ncbi:MAG TPA: SDR family NAD(P)-dependent oxidoreductase [Candidatus Limnocylindrales bacterium]|nr:SDR family NAD(P)-dependent oxidoreductase [Candidatus Limnocylindrales bacterium]
MADLRDVIDAALELSVVGSFSNLGYEIRRRMDDWADPPPGALRGRTVLITGPTSGLGRAASEAFAALGARLVLVGRDAEKLIATRAELVSAYPDVEAATVVADMSSLASVSEAVDVVRASETRLDVLIDNAGVINHRRIVTADGLEATFATMVVGPFRLISGLLPLLRGSREARVISVTSGGMYAQQLDLDDLGYERGEFDGTRAYARAKRAQVALVREWARRLGPPSDSGIAVNAMHPGWAATPGLAASLPAFSRVMGPILRTPAAGIDTLVWLASAYDAGKCTGRLYLDRRPRPFDRAPITRLSAGDRRRLWDAVVTAAKVEDPLPDR